MKTMIAYKLFRVLQSGEITPLFINKTCRLQRGKVILAENHPTKGFAHIPFGHCCSQPIAPHLSMKGRAWYEIEIYNYTEFKRPVSQGSIWYLASKIKIIKPI